MVNVPGYEEDLSESLMGILLVKDGAFGTFQIVLFSLLMGVLVSHGSSHVSQATEDLSSLVSPGLVGSVILPALGAFPDVIMAMFTIFESKHPERSAATAVGVLMGSSVALQAVSTFLVVLAGRVDLRKVKKRGRSHLVAVGYHESKGLRLSRKDKIFSRTGIEINSPMFSTIVAWLFFSSLGFIVLAGVPLFKSTLLLLIGSIASFVVLCSYAVYYIRFVEDKEHISSDLQTEFVKTLDADTVNWYILNEVRPGSASYMHPRHFKDALLDVVVSDSVSVNDIVTNLELRKLLYKGGVLFSRNEIIRIANMIDRDNIEDGKVKFWELLVAFEMNYTLHLKRAVESQEVSVLSRKSAHRFLQTIKSKFDDLVPQQDLEYFKEHAQDIYVHDALGSDVEEDFGLSSGDSELKSLRDGQESETEPLTESDSDGNDSEYGRPTKKHIRDTFSEEKLSVLGILIAQGKSALWMKIAGKFSWGLIVLLLTADPFTDAVVVLGVHFDISAFLVAAFVTPIASNALEFYVAYTVSAEKSLSGSQSSLASMYGGAIMNNTVGLGILLLVMYVKGVEGDFAYRAISVPVASTITALLMYKRKIVTLGFATFMLLLFPLAIVFSDVLDNL